MFENGTAIADTAADSETVQAASTMPDARFDAIKARLAQEFGETAFRSWISPVSFVSAQQGTLELAAPSRLVRDWVRTHYADRIRALWSAEYGLVARVECTVSAAAGRIPFRSTTPSAMAAAARAPSRI